MTSDQRPLSAHTKKQIRFAEILAKGIYSIAEAARLAGYSPKVADKSAYRWIGKCREDSEFPVLWDYYEKLKRENLRQFDINAQSVLRELALIAFADLSSFIELPSRERENKMLLAVATEEAVCAVYEYRINSEQYRKECEIQGQQKPGKGRKKILCKPSPPTDNQYRLAQNFQAMTKETRSELMAWKNYRPGSIRLRNREEIPEALLPALAEITETKEGVRIKLHDKISALDKLARYLKMYVAESKDEGEISQVKEINIFVNGSRSDLLTTNRPFSLELL